MPEMIKGGLQLGLGIVLFILTVLVFIRLLERFVLRTQLSQKINDAIIGFFRSCYHAVLKRK